MGYYSNSAFRCHRAITLQIRFAFHFEHLDHYWCVRDRRAVSSTNHLNNQINFNLKNDSGVHHPCDMLDFSSKGPRFRIPLNLTQSFVIKLAWMNLEKLSYALRWPEALKNKKNWTRSLHCCLLKKEKQLETLKRHRESYCDRDCENKEDQQLSKNIKILSPKRKASWRRMK